MLQIKTAVFGSAFNPPHMGHADVINQALELFDCVIVVPSFAHAFGKRMAPFELRLDMVHALVEHHPDWQQRVVVSDIEKTIAANKPAGAPIYTYDVMSKLAALHQHQKLTFVVGPDNADPQTWAKFYKAKEIDRRWGRWEAKERKHIRSTALRNMLKAGDQPALNECPAEVWTLYRQYFE